MGEMSDYYREQEEFRTLNFPHTVEGFRCRLIWTPIWTTLDGEKFYEPREIGNEHLVNIKKMLVRNNRSVPGWLELEMYKRKL